MQLSMGFQSSGGTYCKEHGLGLDQSRVSPPRLHCRVDLNNAVASPHMAPVLLEKYVLEG